MEKSKVYAFPESSGYITRIEGGYTTPKDLTGWVLMDEGEGDRYNLCQSNYFPGPLITDSGAYRYKLVDGKPVECTKEEIEEQESANQPKPTPTSEERIAGLEAENKTLTAQVNALSGQLDFQEECIVEMANIIYA